MPGFGRGRGGFGGDQGGRGRPPERRFQPPSPPEKPKLQEVWEQDPQFQERCVRMLEHAKRLKCEEACRVMLAMVRSVDGFARMEQIFIGPSAKQIEEKKRMLSRDRREDEAEEEAWREVHRKFERFDIPDSRGASDWGRAIGTFKATIIPGEGMPGVFDVVAPEGGEKGDERWQRFEVWCEGKGLNARGIFKVGETVKKELDVYPKDRDAVKNKLDGFTLGQLDQIISAGYHSLEDVRVSSGSIENGYKPLSGLMGDLDPEREKQDTDAAWAVAEKARNEFMAPHAIAPRVEGQKWRAKSFRAQHEWASLWREAMQVFDHAYEMALAERHTPAPAVEIANQSAALTRSPVAMIVARRSRAGDRNFANGIHPVSPEVIKALAGEEAVYAVKPYLRFDKTTGQVVSEQNFHLLQHSGPLLETRVTPEKSSEGVTVFAKALIEEKGNISEELPFLVTNRNLLESDADRIYHCSRGALSADGFDLEGWYRERLTALGNISSVAEVKARASELTLAIADIFPGQEQRVARIDKEYPTRVDVHGHTYQIEYHYSPARDGGYGEMSKPAALRAVIKIIGSAPKEQLLQWPSDTRVTVGPSDEPIAVNFRVSSGGFDGQQEKTDSVEMAQEIVDATRLRQEWEKYPDKDKEWRVPMRVEDPFPLAKDLVAEQFPPYTTAKNGEQKFPVLAIEHIGIIDSKSQAYGVRIGLYPTRLLANEAEMRCRDAHKTNQARDERIKALNPEQLQRAKELRNALVTRVRALDWKNNPYAYLYAKDVDIHGTIRNANESLEDGYLGKAFPILEKIEIALGDQVERPWELFQEGKTLLDEMKKMNVAGYYRWNNMFDATRYIGEYTKEKPPTTELLTKAINAMKDALNGHEARQK